jgi:pimeloyl-ACP methyl ester carboxylesterase
MPDRDISNVKLYGTEIELTRFGRGKPMVIFHGPWGNPGRLPYLDELSIDFEIYLPTHPGFGNSQRNPSLETIHDLVDFYMDFLDYFGLDSPTLMGFSLGGWLAAELAATRPDQLGKLVLVGAAGLRIEEARIADIFLLTRPELMALTFYDAQSVKELAQLCPETPSEQERDLKERSQIMAQILAWKPFMHNPKLPYRLHRISIPTLLIWGREDGVVPLPHGEAYAKAIPGAQLKVIDRCGHAPQLERPAEFVSLVKEFLLAS